VLLGGLEEAGLVSRGYDLWGDVEVRRVDEAFAPPGSAGSGEEVREEVVRVHASLPGEGGTISVPELARRAGVRPVVAQSALFKLMADGSVEAVPRGSLADIRLKREGLDDRQPPLHSRPAKEQDARRLRSDPDRRDLHLPQSLPPRAPSQTLRRY
jgi:hypothetical protein